MIELLSPDTGAMSALPRQADVVSAVVMSVKCESRSPCDQPPRLGGIQYSTRTPKYLEYVYILTVIGSLSQIAIASPKLSEYFQMDEGQFRLAAQADARGNWRNASLRITKTSMELSVD